MGNLQPIGGAPKMQFLGEGDEVAKPAQIQGVSAVMVVAMFCFVRQNASRNAIRKKHGAPSVSRWAAVLPSGSCQTLYF